METESRKLIGEFDGAEVALHGAEVSASCNRVPTLDGHPENVWADTRRDVTVEAAAEAMASFPSADLPSSPDPLIEVFEDPERPQPRLDRMRGDGMAVTAGGIQETGGGVQFNCLAHNTLRGAAGASLLNGELLVENGWV